MLFILSFIDLMIESAREKPALWNMQSAELKNRLNKNTLWDNVLSDLCMYK